MATPFWHLGQPRCRTHDQNSSSQLQLSFYEAWNRWDAHSAVLFTFPVLSSLACAAPLACKRGYLFRHRDSTNQFRILRYGVWPTQKIALDFVASFVRKKRELTINGIDWTSECRECP